MSNWFVELEGAQIDLERLARLPTDLFVISHSDGRYSMSSDAFAGDASQVKATAAGLVDLAWALLKLDDDSTGAIRTGTVIEKNPAGGANVTIFPGPAVATARVGRPTILGGSSNSNPDADLAGQIEVALQHPKVAQAVRYAADGDWVGLYKAYEVIGDEVGDVVALGWSSSGERELFTRSANTQQRHAEGRYQPPRNPMTVSQGHHYIAGLVRRWIDTL